MIFTPLQNEILRLWQKRLNKKEIASELGYSRTTIDNQWRKICEEAGVDHPADLLGVMGPKPPELIPGRQEWYNRELAGLI